MSTIKKTDSTRAKRINKKIQDFKTEICIINPQQPYSLNISIGAWAGSTNLSYKEDLYEFKKYLKHHINQIIRTAFKKNKYSTHILVTEGAEDSDNCQIKNKLAFFSIELVVFFQNRIEFGGQFKGESYEGIETEVFTLCKNIIKLMTSVDWLVVKPSKK